MSELKCYRIDDGATHYVAAATPEEVQRVLTELEMWCAENDPAVEHVPDEQVDDTHKIEQSEDDAKPEGYTLRESLAKARAEGKAQLLSTTEF